MDAAQKVARASIPGTGEGASRKPDSCPMCSGALRIGSEQYGPSDVLALWECSGRYFPQKVRDSFATCEPTILHRCDRCGFGFYRPAWAAPAGFYDALQTDSATYYLEEKWEYKWALRQVQPGDRVLDVGCGAGFFLQLAKNRGATCVGIEPAPSARAQAVSRGFEVHDSNVADAPTQVGQDFDMVCAFQVLEHVLDPVAFTQALADCTRPGGSLIIAVPNSEGSLRWVKDPPSNLPPHHLTHWTVNALTALAARLELRVVDLAYEPLDIPHHWDHLASWWTNAVLRGRGAGDPAYTPAGFLRRVGSRAIGTAARTATRAGLRTVPWIRGHTVAVTLRKMN